MTGPMRGRVGTEPKAERFGELAVPRFTTIQATGRWPHLLLIGLATH